MPSSSKPKPKPSEIAAEAKKIYIPYIKKHYPDWPTTSYLIADTKVQIPCTARARPADCRIAIIEGDPIDVALSWATTDKKEGEIPVINMANDKRPGGDWEACVMAPEENLCRQSNLFATLTDAKGHHSSNYPIPTKGGIYSEHVVVFRCGPEKYTVWKDFKALPIISVPPVRRPKLDATNKQYSFDEERELMKEKIRTGLRIAAYYNHSDICIGAFGCGPIFRNPTREVARMFRDILFFDNEFRGQFANVCFAFEPMGISSSGSSKEGSPGSSTASSISSSSKSSSSHGKTDMAIFKEIFDVAKIYAKDRP